MIEEELGVLRTGRLVSETTVLARTLLAKAVDKHRVNHCCGSQLLEQLGRRLTDSQMILMFIFHWGKL